MDQAHEYCPLQKHGVIIGGSGLIGGAITNYFKTKTELDFELLSPNSKRLNLRDKEDIRGFFSKFRPSFIINAAISPIDSDPLLAYETNYLGTINLAKVALAYRIPYIHISSASILPMGVNLREEDMLQLKPGLANYRKSKLMAERSLAFLHRTRALDYTAIRLAVVYGKHDHKIQGFHRLLFSLANEAMPFLLTRKGVFHSYSNAKKIPPFIDFILQHREQFAGETYNFVDPEPVELCRLILTIKSYLQLSRPKEIYIPYAITRSMKKSMKWLARILSRIGVDVRIPAEMMFMKNFYQTQTLSPEKLLRSGYRDPEPEVTVYSEIPALLEYYLSRWEHLNLIGTYNKDFFSPKKEVNEFLSSPEQLMDTVHGLDFTPNLDLSDLL